MRTTTATTNGARRGRPGYDQAAVLATAVEMFTAHGYDATSMGMLAERLGISKSAIYHHVPAKVEILRMALDHALTPLEAVFDDARAASGAAADRLRFVLRSTLDVLFDRREYVALLLRLRGNTPVEQEALARRRVLDRQVAAIVAAAQDEGSLRNDMAPGPMARFIFGSVNSLIEWYRPERAGSGGGLNPDQVADAVLELLLRGMLVPETSEAALLGEA